MPWRTACPSNVKSSDTYACARCQGCTYRQYVASWGSCDGTGGSLIELNPNNMNLCMPCETSCKPGQYVANLCTGRSTINTEVCRDCASCPYGHYHAKPLRGSIHPMFDGGVWVPGYIEQTPCNGFGILSSDGVADCDRCDSCPFGKYASDVKRCTGNGIWKDPFTCTDCKPCASGYEHETPCDGFSFNDTCKLCPACLPGEYMVSHWNSTFKRMVCGCRQCLDAPGDVCPIHYRKTGAVCTGKQPFDEACAECSLCNAGEYIAGQSFCSGATFDDVSAGSCRPCRSSCPANHYLNGSCILGNEIKDRLCVPCSTRCPYGYYAIGKCNGTTDFDTKTCAPCGSCLPGQYQVGFCDGTSGIDTTSCAPCNYTSCETLQTLVGQCTGMDTRDTSQCVRCSTQDGTPCATNQYVDTTLCNATTNWYGGKCRNCDTMCLSHADNSSLAPTGQYRLIPCTGLTNSNLVCANCTQNCPLGHYITTLCDGSGDSDTAKCEACTCPDGFYARRNTCTGKQTFNSLECVPCTAFESCPDGHYLSGTCSTLSNTACTPCRSQCKAAEVEAQTCGSGGRNRVCLPDLACFQDCPVGFYESTPCRPPNVAQQCTACSQCPVGYHIKQQCSNRNDTVCQRCTSSICTEDQYNAQFAPSGGCQGTELLDNVRCGVITESYGERCAPNSFKFEQRVPMPHAWGRDSLVPNSTTLFEELRNDPLFEPSVKTVLSDAADNLAFDVHPSRKLYAYCSGNAILTYDYTGASLNAFIDFAYVPEPCSDIRFAAEGKTNYLIVTSSVSSRLYRCDPQCSTGDPFKRKALNQEYACAKPHNTTRRWGGGYRVYCIEWIGIDSLAEDRLLQEGSTFRGGVQIFGSNTDTVVYAAGAFSRTLFDSSISSSWIFVADVDYSPSRGVVHTFPPGVQILGPPAYNRRLRRLFVPAHDHRNSSRRMVVYQIAMRADGSKDTSVFTGGVSEFYVQLYPGGMTGLGVPVIPGFALRHDTGAISIIDESYRQIHVLACAKYSVIQTSSAVCNVRSAPVVSTSYGPAAYKDVEFIGQTPLSWLVDPLSMPSKLFFTSLQSMTKARAELYVRCAKCYGGSITSNEQEAQSDSDCFCGPGFMISSVRDVGLTCTQCQCMDGQYLDETSSRDNCDGRGLFKPGCKRCYVTCEQGSYMRGSCDGSQTANPMECVPCTMNLIAQHLLLSASQQQQQSPVCPAASKIDVKRGAMTVIRSASAFRSDCTNAQGLDCARRQALSYPFDGNDLLEDLAPRALRLQPVSASGRSKGPSLELLEQSSTNTTATRSDDRLLSTVLLPKERHMRTAAAQFNASNHEFYRIPVMGNMFDPTLAVRVIPSANRSSMSGDARRLQSSIVWEQGATLCLWYKFASSRAGSQHQTLFEMSNGYNTEHVYVRRVADTWDLAFGVYHSQGVLSKEQRTSGGQGVPLGAGYWHHLCWSMRHVLEDVFSSTAMNSTGAKSNSTVQMQHPIASSNTSNSTSLLANNNHYLLPESLFVWSSVPFSFSQASSLVAVQAMRGYRATWTIRINGETIYENLPGIMPIEGTYSVSYVGYGTTYASSFFHGSISDLRLFERALDIASMNAIFSGHACCKTFVAGSYVDTSNVCSAPSLPDTRQHRNSLYNSEFCRACKSDCGPFHYIENEENACSGRATSDATLCQPCSPCSQGQYMNGTCSGTSFSDEATCPPCKYKSSEDCPLPGQVMVGRCEGDQIYDTSVCIDCVARCVGAEQDPQGRGQFIERLCTTGANDYVCRPCSARCPVGTYVSVRCTGTGRTNTGCSTCRHFCQEAQMGVPGAHGQYISGRCDGSQTLDTQVCRDCSQCQEGYYPSNLCSGITFNDTVTCTKCRTSCPDGFYLSGNCKTQEVVCVPCDPPCANQSEYLEETRACANGMNRECRATTLCKDPSGCPSGFFESAPCRDPEGPKYCSRCKVCSKGQYQLRPCTNTQNAECANCTRECPNALEHAGMVGECATGLDTVDAVSCVPAINPSTGLATSSLIAGGRCGTNEWYSGGRFPVFVGTAPALDTETLLSSTLPYKSDFSARTMDTVAYLGVIGASASSATRQTIVSVYVRLPSRSQDHFLLATFRPRENYFERLDYYGSNRALNNPNYPMASTSEWNAVDVMLSHDDQSVYVFFSNTYDYIAKCSLANALRIITAPPSSANASTNNNNNNNTLPYKVPASECLYLSPRVYYSDDSAAEGSSTLVDGTSFVLKGCTRLIPGRQIACLYDVGGAKSLLYAVNELSGRKTVLDSYSMALSHTGVELGRARSPPAWDPVTLRVYYMAEMSSFDGDSSTGATLRFVQVGPIVSEDASEIATSATGGGIVWQGGAADNYDYHSMVLMRYRQAEAAATLAAVCKPPSCPAAKSIVTFRISQTRIERNVAAFSQRGDTWDLGVKWHWVSDSNNANKTVGFVAQQLYILSRTDKMWGLWTHCANCPANSFSNTGSLSSLSSTEGVGTCKCQANFYGVLAKPVVDTCKACRIQFQPDGVTVSPLSALTPCAWGHYKTNVACLPGNADRTVDTTCARCQQSCRPGDVSTGFSGEYISLQCDGTGTSATVGCSVCTSVCDGDDQYMRSDIVCSGRDVYDTRPEKACSPCTTKCQQGAYVANRCLREDQPRSNTARCVLCSPCNNGQVSMCEAVLMLCYVTLSMT